MKTSSALHLVIRLFLCLLPSAFCLAAEPVGTAFTYQGRLNDGTNPASGNYDLRFTIYDVGGGGALVGGPITNSPVAVSNGLFTATLDFGSGIFTGNARWLEIGVRTNGSVADFTRLSPRQPLTPTPYAISAGNLTGVLPAAQLTGTLPSAQLAGTYGGPVTFNNGANVFDGTFYGSFLGSSFIGGGFSGQFIGDGSGLINLNASQLAAGIVPDARLGTNILRTSQVWTLTGNAGTTPGTHFLGTTDNQPLELRVNNQQGLRIETYSSGPPNILGGSDASQFNPGTRGGAILGGEANQVGADYCFIGGGSGGYIGVNSSYSAILGGFNNYIESESKAVTIAGGKNNRIGQNSPYGFIGGGTNNAIGSNALYSVIGGGYDSRVGAKTSWAAIGGGYSNEIGTNSGTSVIAGGNENTIGDNSVSATIAGGSFNQIATNSTWSVIGGGWYNRVLPDADFAIIPGGDNCVASKRAFAAGTYAKATNSGSFVWSDGTSTTTSSASNNTVTMRASGGFRFFTGTGTSGAQLPAGATSWSALSDRNLKKDIQPLDCQAILDKLAGIPLTRWHYTWEESTVTPHVGPMAQDFKAAFYPGRDDKSISTLEFDGVALAAIQGLNQKVEDRSQRSEVRSQQLEKRSRELEARSQKLEAENAELRRRLDQLESLLLKSTPARLGNDGTGR